MKETYNANAGSVKVLLQAAEGYVLASRSGGGRPMFSKEVRQAVLDGKQDAGPVVVPPEPDTPTGAPAPRP
jgi:hypothetical protein